MRLITIITAFIQETILRIMIIIIMEIHFCNEQFKKNNNDDKLGVNNNIKKR